MKAIVVYFSRGGHTAKAALKIREATGADVFEIKTDKKYGGYVHACRLASREFNDRVYPDYIGGVENFAEYDTVFLGFPLWYGKCPNVVLSFAKRNDFSGKRVFPFCTNGFTRSQPEDAVAIIRGSLAGAKIMQPRVFNRVNEKDILSWLAGEDEKKKRKVIKETCSC